MEEIYKEIINNLSNHWQGYVIAISVMGLFLIDANIAYSHNKEYRRLKIEKKNLEEKIKDCRINLKT